MASQDRWNETITVADAYRAMLDFVWTYYRVGGEQEKEVEFFAAHISQEPPNFLDLALQDEWFEAIDKVRS